MNDSTEFCPHCREPLPPTSDAFCTYCQERIDEPPNNDIGFETSSLLQRLDISELTAEMRIDSGIDLPSICVLCGQDGDRFQNFRIHRKHEAKKFLLKNIVNKIIKGGIIGSLLVDEVYDERPLDLRLPICGDHAMQDLSKLLDGRLIGDKSRARSAIVSNLHPGFVETAKEHISKRWESLEN